MLDQIPPRYRTLTSSTKLIKERERVEKRPREKERQKRIKEKRERKNIKMT